MVVDDVTVAVVLEDVLAVLVEVGAVVGGAVVEVMMLALRSMSTSIWIKCTGTG